MGSNGLTSARHDVCNKGIAEKYPESYDPAIPYELVFSGSKKLTDPIHISFYDASGRAAREVQTTAGKLVLSPTRTYAPVIKEVFKSYSSQIHGMVHCSGDDQTKVPHFITYLHIIQQTLYPYPTLFPLIPN